jgi:hypothetical protein
MTQRQPGCMLQCWSDATGANLPHREKPYILSWGVYVCTFTVCSALKHHCHPVALWVPDYLDAMLYHPGTFARACKTLLSTGPSEILSLLCGTIHCPLEH